MDEDNNIGANLEQPEYLPDVQSQPVFDVAPTGEQMDLSFLNDPYNPNWPDAKKLQWEKRWFANISTTPAAAAKESSEMMREERKAISTSKASPEDIEKAQNAYTLTSRFVDRLQRSIDAPKKQYVGAGSYLPAIRGSDRYNFYKDVETLTGEQFLGAIPSLVGMGALSNVEGDKATKASGNLDLGLSEDKWNYNAQELKSFIEVARDRAASRLKSYGVELPAVPQYSQTGQSQQPAQQQQAQLPGMVGGYMLKTPKDPDFDPNENNGNPYYEER
jgi:hypothetical protein